MTGEPAFIRVAALDLAQIILDSAQARTDSLTPTPVELNVLFQAAEDILALRAAVRDVLDIGPTEVAPDEVLIARLRALNDAWKAAAQGPTPAWQGHWECPECRTKVDPERMVCPTCIPDEGPAEQTGRFTPVTPPPGCVAHGTPSCPLCTLNPGSCGTTNQPRGCSSYRETGMHWDTCPNRVSSVASDGAWVLGTGKVIPADGHTPWQPGDVVEAAWSGGSITARLVMVLENSDAGRLWHAEITELSGDVNDTKIDDLWEIREGASDFSLVTHSPKASPSEELTDRALSDLLLLVGREVSPATLDTWTPQQREEVANWAGAVHLNASDNDVSVPPVPMVLQYAERVRADEENGPAHALEQ